MVNINTNTGALMAAKGMKLVQRNVDNASLRLSTGLRVKFASDDAAGLAVSNKMISQIRGMEVALKNTSDGISLVQAAIAGMQTSSISSYLENKKQKIIRIMPNIFIQFNKSSSAIFSKNLTSNEKCKFEKLFSFFGYFVWLKNEDDFNFLQQCLGVGQHTFFTS